MVVRGAAEYLGGATQGLFILHLVLQVMYCYTRCLPPDRLIPFQCHVFCSLPIIRLLMIVNQVVELEMASSRSFEQNKRDEGRSHYLYGKMLLQKDTIPDPLSVL